VPRDLPEELDLLVDQEQRGHLVILEHRGPLVWLERQAQLELVELLEPLVLKDRRAHRAVLDLRELRVVLVCREPLVASGRWVLWVPRERLEAVGRLVHLEVLVTLDLVARREHQEHKDRLVYQDLRVRQVRQVHLE